MPPSAPSPDKWEENCSRQGRRLETHVKSVLLSFQGRVQEGTPPHLPKTKKKAHPDEDNIPPTVRWRHSPARSFKSPLPPPQKRRVAPPLRVRCYPRLLSHPPPPASLILDHKVLMKNNLHEIDRWQGHVSCYLCPCDGNLHFELF